MTQAPIPSSPGLGRLSTLLPEVRSIIWKSYFGSDGLVQENPHNDLKLRHGARRTFRKMYDRNLLLTSQAIYHEAVAYEGQHVSLEVPNLSRKIPLSLHQRTTRLFTHGRYEDFANDWKFDDSPWPALKDFHYKNIEFDDLLLESDEVLAVDDCFKASTMQHSYPTSDINLVSEMEKCLWLATKLPQDLTQCISAYTAGLSKQLLRWYFGLSQ